LTVTVAYPQLYERKPLAALAEIVRRSVEAHFKQKPEDIELSFSLGRSGSGREAEVQGHAARMVQRVACPIPLVPAKAGTQTGFPLARE
jgi:hypothetical protein